MAGGIDSEEEDDVGWVMHIRWTLYNARTLDALEAPQAIPRPGIEGTKGRFRKLGRSIRPRARGLTLVFSFLRFLRQQRLHDALRASFFLHFLAQVLLSSLLARPSSLLPLLFPYLLIFYIIIYLLSLFYHIRLEEVVLSCKLNIFVRSLARSIPLFSFPIYSASTLAAVPPLAVPIEHR